MNCTGKDPEKAKQLALQADTYYIMARFYEMDAPDQRVFMAMFNAMVEERKCEKNDSEK